MPFTHHDLLKFNLVPRVSHLTAPWSECKMRDLWKQGCSNLGTAGWYCVRKGGIFLACAFPDTPVNKVLSEVKLDTPTKRKKGQENSTFCHTIQPSGA